MSLSPCPADSGFPVAVKDALQTFITAADAEVQCLRGKVESLQHDVDNLTNETETLRLKREQDAHEITFLKNDNDTLRQCNHLLAERVATLEEEGNKETIGGREDDRRRTIEQWRKKQEVELLVAGISHLRRENKDLRSRLDQLQETKLDLTRTSNGANHSSATRSSNLSDDAQFTPSAVKTIEASIDWEVTTVGQPDEQGDSNAEEVAELSAGEGGSYVIPMVLKLHDRGLNLERRYNIRSRSEGIATVALKKALCKKLSGTDLHWEDIGIHFFGLKAAPQTIEDTDGMIPQMRVFLHRESPLNLRDLFQPLGRYKVLGRYDQNRERLAVRREKQSKNLPDPPNLMDVQD